MELLLPPRPFRAVRPSPVAIALLRSFEGDGAGPPRQPGSSPGPYSLRGGQAGPRFNVMLGGWGLLVDSSGRYRSSLLPPLSCLSLWRFSVSALLVRVATLRTVVQLLRPS